MSRGRWVEDPRADRGMTLIEVLVAMGLFAVLGSLLLGLGISTADLTRTSSKSVDLNEESRVALERLSRELRQAQTVSAIEVQEGTGTFIGIRFETDFNGDGFINAPTATPTATASPSAGPGFVEPEIVAYRWDADQHLLTLTDGSVSPPVTEPILAAKVTSFEVRLWSSRWSPLPSNPADGTAWSELEPGAPAPDAQGWWSPDQLDDVDRVTVRMTVELGGRSRDYSTDVYLRNTHVVGEAPSAP